MSVCRLEFEFTNNIAEYEALIQGLYKAIGLNIKYLQVFEDSKIEMQNSEYPQSSFLVYVLSKQVRNTIHFLSGHLRHYQSLVQDLTY
jgi:ribonuclease HI